MACSKQKPYDVYISHSDKTKDIDIAYIICDNLEKLGFKCYLKDRNINASETEVRSIDEANKKSKRLVLLLSETFLHDPLCQAETEMAITRCVRSGVIEMIPVILDPSLPERPAFPKQWIHQQICLTYEDTTAFYEKMKAAITAEVRRTIMVPAGDIAHGLAWSYYCGYLRIILPDLHERINNMKNLPDLYLVKRLVIIMPILSQSKSKLEDYSPHILQLPFKLPCTHDRAGHMDRNYDQCIYQITNPENKDESYLVVCDMATPMVTMQEMFSSNLAEITREELFRQQLIFQDKVETILECPANVECMNKTIIMKYDEGQEKDDMLQSLLCLVREHKRREEAS